MRAVGVQTSANIGQYRQSRTVGLITRGTMNSTAGQSRFDRGTTDYQCTFFGGCIVGRSMHLAVNQVLGMLMETICKIKTEDTET